MANIFSTTAFTPLGSYVFEQDEEAVGDPNCAWCNDEAGIAQGEASHGVCTRHSQALESRLANSREERRNRRNRR